MRISQAFPSKYLKSDEVGQQRFVLTIRDVQMEDIGDSQHKPVVYFNEVQKGMVLNKTNAEMIVHLYGDDTMTWTGRQVELYTTMVSFQGKSTLGLRVMAPAPAMPAHPGMTSPQMPGQPPYQPPGMPNLQVPAHSMPNPSVPPAPAHRDPNAPLPTQPQGGGSYDPGLDDPA